MGRWAVFDIDGTLLPHRSMESMFIMHAIKTKQIKLRHLSSYAFNTARLMLTGHMKNAFRINKSYFKGLHEETLVQLATDFFKNNIQARISETAIKKVSELQENGFRILILSGAPEILARNLSSILTTDHMICTSLEIKNGRFTGNILGDHPYGASKKEILLRIKDELEIDFHDSVTFANHETDVIYMELFGKATAVNPTDKLRRIAESRGWEIVEW